MHFIVAGGVDSGNSSLAVGVGTEFAFRMGIGRYTTLVKLLESAQRCGKRAIEREFDDGRILWPWQTSELLIIDDVQLNFRLLGLSPTAESTEVLAQQLNKTLRELVDPIYLKSLCHRRTVWVLGDQDDAGIERWRDVIAQIINVPPGEIRTLRLGQTMQEAQRRRAMPRPMEQVRQW
jgi:hypothetical protein